MRVFFCSLVGRGGNTKKRSTLFLLTEALPPGAPARAAKDSARRGGGQRVGRDDGEARSRQAEGGELGLFEKILNF